jgi:hypothetical protein
LQQTGTAIAKVVAIDGNKHKAALLWLARAVIAH